MATYADLQARIVDFLKDTEVDAAKTREFIELAEYKIDRDMLDTANGGAVPRQKLTRYSGTTENDGTFVLPTDYHDARAVTVNGLAMRYASPELVPWTVDGVPQQGFEDAVVLLDYYQRLPPLSDANTSNWLLDVGYDAYLYGAALQWISWGQDEQNLALWTTYYRDAVRTVKMTYGPRPRGGNRRQNGRYYKGFYTVIGTKIYFGRAH